MLRIVSGWLLAAALVCAQVRPASLAVRNALIIEGNGTPASGPKDILIEGDTITRIVPVKPRIPAAKEIDAHGSYVMPGLIDAHAHVQEERGGIPQPLEYNLKMWLACGITTIRDVGSDTVKTIQLRKQSAEGKVAAPRIFVYAMFQRAGPARNAEEARMRVREIKAMGADGIKSLGIYRDVMEAMLDEAHKLQLPVAHHTGVEETNAWDDIRLGTRSIEHWYGIPDAALADGVQKFPANYNYNDETDRFRYGGRLWREASWDRLMKVLDGMVKANVAWDPTLSIYEASRDLMRAQNQSFFHEYLHPVLEEFFKPNPANHGSYFLNWTSTDEAYWKENFRIWMAALREFEKRGGTIGCGDDAGFIYSMYGFGLIRELELHQEAGFDPLQVIRHATANNARILGQEQRLGRVRVGYAADLLVLNGNPLENFKILYPSSGGIEWTIKDGIPYHAPTLAAEVREIVRKAREKK